MCKRDIEAHVEIFTCSFMKYPPNLIERIDNLNKRLKTSMWTFSTGDELSDGQMTLKLISGEEKKEFLVIYMTHKMELLANGIDLVDRVKDDQLSRFWTDPDSNYLLWIIQDGRKLGFAAIVVEEMGQASLVDLAINRDERGKGNGRKALEEIVRFSRYRGLKKIMVKYNKINDEIRSLFKFAGFQDNEGELEIDL
jgi:ribosomal protein S18 acetylase RimI-like enzyme